MCLRVRNGACDAITSAAALRLSPCLCVLRVPKKNERITQPPNFRLQIRPVILSVPTFLSHMVQYNRVRGSSAKHATDGPKSRKLHPGAHVEKSARLPSEPPYKSKIPKGGFGALWRVFLLYLSSREERWSPRRALVSQSGQ